MLWTGRKWPVTTLLHEIELVGAPVPFCVNRLDGSGLPAPVARISHTSSSRGAGGPHADKTRAAESAGLGEHTLFKPEVSATLSQ